MNQTYVRTFAIVIAVFLIGAFIAIEQSSPVRDRMTLRHLENATFQPPPPAPGTLTIVKTVWTDFWSDAGAETRHAFLPSQAGVLLIAVVVALMVAFDFQRPASARNLELIILLSLGFLLFNVMRFFELLNNPVYFHVMDWVFTGIVVVSLTLVGVAVWRAMRPHALTWRPNLPARALMTLTILLLGVNVMIGVLTPPDDAGFYTNLGAQRLRERGKFPYGDPLLTNSAGAGYGPLLYLAHLPYQFLLNPAPENKSQPTRADLAAGAEYFLPPTLATQLTTVTFHLLGVAAIVAIGWQMAGAEVGWALGALYCSSAYVMGVGGPRESIGGMTFISHIAPPAVSMLAFLMLSRPLAAGALLVAASATVFYPVLFFPAWLGFYWHRRADAVKFVTGCAIAALVIGIPVVALSQAIEGHSVIGTVVKESVGHHQGTDTYGLSTFGFWGQREGLRAWLREPLIAGQFTTSPMFAATIGGAAAMFFLARNRSMSQLALITGAIGILAQWSKIHGTGVYVNWYYPFFLIGLFAARPMSRSGIAAPLEPRRDSAGTVGTAQRPD